MIQFQLRSFARLLLAAMALALCSGCEHDTGVSPDTTLAPTFSSIQTNIFSQNCALSGCHIGAGAPQGLDLSAGQAYAHLVGVASNEVPALQRITASNADSSYLVIKIEGGARMAPGTSRMPLGRTPLSADQIRVIREWIAAGALNN
jgi:hypothetical protein